MPQSLSKSLIHIVFSTKYRQNLIDEEIEKKLFGYIGEICNNRKCTTLRVGGYRNHVHILCHLHRTITQADLVKYIKGNSSKWIKTMGEQYANFYWQDGYGVFSVSQLEVNNLIRYIENQKQHHEKKTFKTEYVKFLDAYDVEYDERYVWD